MELVEKGVGQSDSETERRTTAECGDVRVVAHIGIKQVGGAGCPRPLVVRLCPLPHLIVRKDAVEEDGKASVLSDVGKLVVERNGCLRWVLRM